MSALNFSARFAADVESGAKRQTIRPLRRDGRRPCKEGGDLQLYAGLRTSKARKLADAVCTSVDVITLDRNMADVSGYSLNPEERRILATNDGFRGFPELIAWLEEAYGGYFQERDEPVLPFTGYLIRWDLS